MRRESYLMVKIVVLGGSSPFVIPFFHELKRQANIQDDITITLYGRNTQNLMSICNYANSVFNGIQIRSEYSTDLERALLKSNIILHQIRYGGMKAREEDENFSKKYGYSVDETFGPSKYRSLFRMRDEIIQLSRRISELSPSAFTVNITNPVDIVTQLMINYGVDRCVGICELPRKTLNLTVEMLGLPFELIDWFYEGVNHRGFFTKLSFEDQDLIPSCLEYYKNSIKSEENYLKLVELNAIPLKYFNNITPNKPYNNPRAAILQSISETLLHQLASKSYNYPEIIDKRNPDWYEIAIVPLILALLNDTPSTHVVNVKHKNGNIEERKAVIGNYNVSVLDSSFANLKTKQLINEYIESDKLVYKSIIDPTYENILSALEHDTNVGGDLKVLAESMLSYAQKSYDIHLQ